MKKVSFLVLLISVLLNCKPSFAQSTIINDIDTAKLAKYIQLAIAYYPQKKLLDKRAEGAKTAITINTLSYFDIVNATYIYRPESGTSIAVPGATSNPYAVNGFQFGASFNLGSYLSKPAIGKKARTEYEAAKLETEVYVSTLTLEVKRRYYTYVFQVNELKVATQSYETTKNASDNLKYKFEQNQGTIESYNQSQISESAANTAKLQTELNYLVAKDALEELIGKKLEDVK